MPPSTRRISPSADARSAAPGASAPAGRPGRGFTRHGVHVARHAACERYAGDDPLGVTAMNPLTPAEPFDQNGHATNGS
ncbi:hypothetical protein GCM10010129_64330 [Streptomyces fumigatiscleroticus]|nr:hypothetical protein GCM10010129_64330 [Streptomyces fumigatiscleroticus]